MNALKLAARPPIDAVRRACARWRADLTNRVEPMAECECAYPTSHSSLGPCREAVRLAREAGEA